MKEQQTITDAPLSGLLGAAIALAALVLTARHLVDLHSGEAADPYEAERRQAAYVPMKPLLANEAMAGWWASRPTGASEMDEVEYSLARYALVPTLLCGHADKPVIVIHLDRDEDLEPVLHGGEYRLIARVAPGMAVIRRRP